jgi:hypothetical protein
MVNYMVNYIWTILGHGTKLFAKPAILTVAVLYPTTVFATASTLGTVMGCGTTPVIVTYFLGFVLL